MVLQNFHQADRDPRHVQYKAVRRAENIDQNKGTPNQLVGGLFIPHHCGRSGDFGSRLSIVSSLLTPYYHRSLVLDDL